MSIGKRVKEQRLSKGLTKAALLKICGWKSNDILNRYEKMEGTDGRVSIVQILTLATALDCSAEYLLFGETAHIPPGFGVLRISANQNKRAQEISEISTGTHLGERVRAIREGLGLNYQDILNKMGWKGTIHMLSMYELGQRIPPMWYILDLARFFQCAPSYLVFGVASQCGVSAQSKKDTHSIHLAAIGSRLKATRERMGLGQPHVSKLTGIRKKKISTYEAGHILPNIEQFLALSRTLNESPAYLMFGDENDVCSNRPSSETMNDGALDSGQRYRKARLRSGLTQKEVAKLVSSSVVKNKLSEIEHGVVIPKIDHCEEVANIYQCSPVYLAFGHSRSVDDYVPESSRWEELSAPGERLQAIREYRGFTKERLSQACNRKVNSDRIQKLEAGKSQFTVKVVIALADSLSVPPGYLAFGSVESSLTKATYDRIISDNVLGMMPMSQRIRQLRIERGLSREKIEVLSEQRVTAKMLYGYERGYMPRPAQAITLARLFGCSPGLLIFGVAT